MENMFKVWNPYIAMTTNINYFQLTPSYTYDDVKPGTAHISPGICLMVEKTLVIHQLGDSLMTV